MRKAILPILTATLLTGAAHAGFYGIGENTAVTDMTGDGSIFSGYTGTNGGWGTTDFGFTWSSAQGKTTDATIVSGQTIAGISSIANGGTSYTGVLSDGSAFVRQGATYTRLNPGTGGYQEALYISRDGSTVIGYNYNHNYQTQEDHSASWVWRNGAFQNYATPVGTTNHYYDGISADGSTILGSSDTGIDRNLYHWNAFGAAIAITMPSGFTYPGHAVISGNGTVAFLSSDATDRIVRYNGLDSAPTMIATSYPDAYLGCTNATGSMAGGSTSTSWYMGGEDSEAIIWDAINGIRKASTVIGAAGVDLTGWHLTDVISISDDGQTYAGNGTFNGVNQGWVFSAVPEPSTYGLIGAGALAFTALVRRRAKRKTA